MAVLGGATLLSACGNPPRSAEDALASAQAFVVDATAFEFDAATRTTYVMDAGELLDDESEADPSSDPEWPEGGAGTTTTDRTTITGAWTPEAWETRTDGGIGRYEAKVFGTTAYFRDDMDGESSEWQTYENPKMSRQDLVDELEAMRDEMDEAGDEDGASDLSVESSGASVGLAASLYLGGEGWGGSDLFGDPTGFLRAIGDMSDPELASRDGDTVTVSADLSAPADIEEAWGAPLPAGVMTLTVGNDGAPSRLTLSVSEGDDSVEVEIRFSEWNAPQEITPPGEDEIDRTPWIDEEGVAAVPDVSLVRPTALPEGWELDYVDVVSSDDSFEGCEQVQMGWSPMVSDEPGADISDDYLGLFLLPLACAMESDATPFEVGPFAPLPSRDGAYSVEVLVGDTVVQLDTTLSGSELATLVTSLELTDLETLAAEAAEGYPDLLTS